MTPEQYIRLGLDAAAKACDGQGNIWEREGPIASSVAKIMGQQIRGIDPAEILKQYTDNELRKQNNSGGAE